MAFALKMRKLPRSVIDQKVREAAAILDITEYLKRKPKALSGGQRQRVAIGRAIVRDPQVFLMDEPLSNLDAKLRGQMRTEILKLREKVNTTFVYVTHDQTEAMTLGDRIVIMKDGFIQQIGTPQDVFDRPANLFVAGFIGTPQMNFFDGQLLIDGGRYSVAAGNTVFDLPEERQSRLASKNTPAQDIVFGVRPEHIRLCSPEESPRILARTDVSELMGSTVHLHLSALEKDVVVTLPTADAEGNPIRHGTMGEIAAFTFNGNFINLFHK